MARPRQPADLIKAKGRSQLSKKEYEEKKSGELDVPFVDVTPPACLTRKTQVAEFNEIAGKLLALGIFTLFGSGAQFVRKDTKKRCK